MKTSKREERISAEERETHLWYCPDEKQWILESNIPRHFNKALKVGWKPISQQVYKDGTVCAMAFVAPERGITIRTPNKRELTEEHKAKLLMSKTLKTECDFEDECLDD